MASRLGSIHWSAKTSPASPATGEQRGFLVFREPSHQASRGWHPKVRLCCWAGLLVAWVGCSGGGADATYRVEGIVKFPNGEPLAGGRILFRPTGGASHPARGIIHSDGTFELSTFAANDGAVIGKHKVMITPALPEGYMDEPSARVGYKPPIDSRYQSLRSTPLEFTVVDDGSTNKFEITVHSPGAK